MVGSLDLVLNYCRARFPMYLLRDSRGIERCEVDNGVFPGDSTKDKKRLRSVKVKKFDRWSSREVKTGSTGTCEAPFVAAFRK